MENPCIECGGNCCWHEDCECRKVIPLSVIEDIKAEIKEEISRTDNLGEYNDCIQVGLKRALSIIDEHIDDRERIVDYGT